MNDPIIRKYTSFEEMKADEYRYWQSRPAHERLDAVDEMIQTAYALKGWEIEPDVPRSQRPFVRLPCPWRQAREEPMSELLTSIAAKKKRLDELPPLSLKALASLEHYYDIELTYTSNAIEGNTLSPVETTLVIEKGITVSGKPLKDHLEALDHYDAIRYVRELARQETPITESDVRNLHKLVMQRSAPEIAGKYADLPRYVRTETGRYSFPSPAEVPALMGDFAGWLATASATPDTAFTAQRRLVDIHPFNDGNGRTARLLMNLILIRGGYPPVAVRPEDRLEYIRSLQQEQAGQGAENFNALLYRRLDATLGEYLSALQEAQTPEAKRDKPSGPEPKP